MLFLDIHQLSCGIKQEYKMNKEEYVLMCFFMGNDFLPGIPSLDIREGGLERLMESYKKVLDDDKDFTVLVNNKVDWNRVYRILKPLIAEERQIMIDKQVKYEKDSNRAMHRNVKSLTVEEKLDNIVRINRHVERYVCPKEDGWEKRFYSVTGNSELANATHYRNMFESVYKYYTEGVLEYAINSKILLRSIMLKNTECSMSIINPGVQKYDWSYKSRHWESVYY
jgi:5'-3' exonuclease